MNGKEWRETRTRQDLCRFSIKVLFTAVIKSSRFNFFSCPTRYRTLDITLVILTLLLAARNSEFHDLCYRFRRFRCHDVRLCPGPLLSMIVPFMTKCRILYLAECCITYPKYWSYRIFIVLTPFLTDTVYPVHSKYPPIYLYLKSFKFFE